MPEITTNVSIPASLLPYIIGIWRFREVDVEPAWSITISVNGFFFDTKPARSIQAAIINAVAALKKAKKKVEGK